MKSRRYLPSRVRGVSMLEVLVAIFILTIGLLGVAGIQSQMQTAQVEAYQRAQAVVLLQEMVDRVNANRKNAASYVTPILPLTDDLGLQRWPIECADETTVVRKDACEWNNALFGAAETKSGVTYGSMNGARGCITNPVTTMPREVVVAVVWQGMRPTLAPAATTCGQGQYGTDDRVRRALVSRVVIGCLENDATTGLCVTP